jgi:hypothetical protein
MPDLKQYEPQQLNWTFDFSPRNPIPTFMPVLLTTHHDELVVVGGFEKKDTPQIWGLHIEESLAGAMEALYPEKSLAPLEALRRRRVMEPKALPHHVYLENLALAMQNFLDDRNVPLRSLKPIQHLQEWMEEISKSFFALKPSTSLTRELLDVLCDLKFNGSNWNQIKSHTLEASQWLNKLKKLRAPRTLGSDEELKNSVQKLSWPRGVSAKWERQGDQSGIVIQTKVTNARDWQSFKESLPVITENFWE